MRETKSLDYFVLTLLAFSFLSAGEADHIIFSKITILPDAAESISIYNCP